MLFGPLGPLTFQDKVRFLLAERMILFGYFRAVDGKPCVITSRSYVTDLSYAPYLDMLITMNTDNNDIFEMYFCRDCIHVLQMTVFLSCR